MEFSTSEILITCISREIKNGDWVSQGIGTPLVNSALVLAHMTHAPNLVLYSSVGNTVTMDPGPISLSNFEVSTLGRAIKHLTFEELILDLNLKVKPKEFFRPAQMDRYGNFNNVVIGPYGRPRYKLPGAVGIPEVTEYFDDFYLYIPRHNRRCLVEKIDFLSGVGYLNGESDEERERIGIEGTGPRKLITDLGVFVFDVNRKLITESLHPGVLESEVKNRTAFDIYIPRSVPTTEPPSKEELDLIRKHIDPFSTRELEVLTGKERLLLAVEVFHKENKRNIWSIIR